MLPFGLSTIALIFQVLLTYISRLFVSYYDILLVGIDKDIKSSGIIGILSDNNVLKNQISVSNGVSESRANKISGKINQQVAIDKDVSDKNKKDRLYELSIYCVTNPRNIEDVVNTYDLQPSIALNLLKQIATLGIIAVSGNAIIDPLITDINKIKELIYN